MWREGKERSSLEVRAGGEVGGGLGMTPEMVVCGEVKRPSSERCPKNEIQTAHRKTCLRTRRLMHRDLHL